MKRIFCIVLAVVLLASLTGCLTAEPATTPSSAINSTTYYGNMTEDIRHDVMLSIVCGLPGVGRPLPGEAALLFEDGSPYYSYYYIGTVDEYIVLLFVSNTMFNMQDKFGNEIFLHDGAAALYLYRDHTLYSLEEEYLFHRLTDEILLHKLAACLYQYQAAAGLASLYENWGYADRYRDAEPANTTPLSQAQKTDILYAIGKYYGFDAARPGKGNQVFEDKQTFYLGAYQGWYAAAYLDDQDSMYKLHSVGSEAFGALGRDIVCFYPVDAYTAPYCLDLRSVYEKGLINETDLFEVAKALYQHHIATSDDPEAIRQLYGEFAARYE